MLLAGWLLTYALREQRFNDNLEKIISLLALSDHAGPEERFDAVRHFINSNSRHGARPEWMLGHAISWQSGRLLILLAEAQSPSSSCASGAPISCQRSYAS